MCSRMLGILRNGLHEADQCLRQLLCIGSAASPVPTAPQVKFVSSRIGGSTFAKQFTFFTAELRDQSMRNLFRYGLLEFQKVTGFLVEVTAPNSGSCLDRNQLH